MRWGPRALVERGRVRQRRYRYVGLEGVRLADPKPIASSDAADRDGVEVPLAEDLEHFVLTSAFHREQHPLLRLREHHLVGRQARLAPGNEIQIQLDATAAAGRHLGARAGQAGGAHVLHADDRTGGEGFEAGLEQHLLHERIAHLHRRPFLLAALAELGRRHRRAVNAVAPGLRADVEDGVALAFGAPEEDRGRRCDAETKGVDQRVAAIARLENHLAAHCGAAEGVAVAADAGDDPVE